MNERNEYAGAHKAAEVCTIWPAEAADQMGKMIEQCNLTDHILSTDGRIAGNAPLATRAGFSAEEIHAETFNLDAILKQKNVRAFTDRYPNSPLSGNNPTNDILITKDGKIVKGVQLKYYKNGNATANAFRDIRNGENHYGKTDAMLGPSDQLQDIKNSAWRTELKNRETRPQVAEAARNVRKKITDHLNEDGVDSKPTSRSVARKIASGTDEGKKLHRKIQNEYKVNSTVQKTMQAAGSAAVATSIIAGTINTVSCLDKVQKGEMSIQDALRYILRNTAIAAGDSALKAGGATAAVSMTARIVPNLFHGTVLQTNLASGAVAGTAICAIDIAECLVLVAAGKMTWRELETRMGKNMFQTSAGVTGASIGAAVGAPAGPLGMMLGSLIGGMIGSMAMTVAIENHIERPFREIMDNTQNTVKMEHAMLSVIEQMKMSDTIMADAHRQRIASMKRVADNLVSGDEEMWKTAHDILNITRS